MVGGRFVQGISAALLLAAGLALVTYLSLPEAHGGAVGRLLSLVATVPAIGARPIRCHRCASFAGGASWAAT